MVNPEKTTWSIQRKPYGQYRENDNIGYTRQQMLEKTTWSIQRKPYGQSRENHMVNPEKITTLGTQDNRRQRKPHGQSRENNNIGYTRQQTKSSNKKMQRNMCCTPLWAQLHT